MRNKLRQRFCVYNARQYFPSRTRLDKIPRYPTRCTCPPWSAILRAWYCIRGLRPRSPRTTTWTVHCLSAGSRCDGASSSNTVIKVEMTTNKVKIMMFGRAYPGRMRYTEMSCMLERYSGLKDRHTRRYPNTSSSPYRVQRTRLVALWQSDVRDAGLG